MDNKEYLRPDEVKAVFGVDKSTFYRWARDDKEFPELIKPSRKITLINRKEFENYLKLRSGKRVSL
jgi:predicted DNA-binding transcriptional regulator AlpA